MRLRWTVALTAMAALCVWTTADTARANVYPSGLTADTSTLNGTCGVVNLTYFLNEDADGAPGQPGVKIEVLAQDNSVVKTVTLPRQKRGAHTFVWDGRNDSGARVPNGTYRIRVTAADFGYAAWTKISDDSEHAVKFYSPKGVDVNTDPTSPYYGRIYVSESLAGTTGGRTTTDGIFALNADRTDAIGQGDVGRTGGIDWQTAATGDTSGASPFKLTVGPDGNVYVTDYSDGHSGLWRLNGNLDDDSGVEVLDSTGRDPAGLNGTHGSISSVIVEGSGPTLSIVTLDEDFDGPFPGGYMLRYDIGNGSLPFVGITRREADLETEVVNSLVDAVRASDGKYYWVQYRLASGAPNFMVFTASPAPDAFSEPGAETIHFTMTGALGYNAIDIDESRDRIAIATRGTNGGVHIRKISDPGAAPVTVPTTGSQNRDVAFDAAGNLYVVNATSERLTVWSPPGGAHSMSTTSAPITLNKSGSGGPTITAQPQHAGVSVGGTAIFDVTATGTNLTYQWYRDGVALTDNDTVTGSTTAHLEISGITEADSGSSFFVQVCDDGGVVISNTVLISIGATISQHPANKTICINGTDSLTVLASGQGQLSYEWQKFVDPNWVKVENGGPYSGAETATLTITGATSAEAGQYRVLISDAGAPGAVTTSATAVVTVSTGPVQAAHSGDKTVDAGGAATFQTKFNGTGPVYYRWYKNVNGVETLLFEGVDLDFITYSNIPCNDNGAEIFARGTDQCGTSEGSPRAKLIVNNPSPLPEVCDNGIDDDCNGFTDCDDPACAATPSCCNIPFADAEGGGNVGLGSGDQDIDQSDFAFFQLCFTGPNGTLSQDAALAYCRCLDRDNGGVGDGDVDLDDYAVFEKCLTGPSVLWTSNPDCP